MKKFLEKVKLALQKAWEKINPALQKAWGNVKAAIGKLPFNGYAAKVPALAKVAAFANYAVCVAALVVVVAVVGGIAGGGKKGAGGSSGGSSGGKAVNIQIAGMMDSSGSVLNPYWKVLNGSSEFAVKKGASFTVPEIEGQDGRKHTEYEVWLSNFDSTKNLTVKAGEKISYSQLQEWADAQVDAHIENLNTSMASMGDALTDEMKAVLAEQNEKQIAAMRELNTVILNPPSSTRDEL